MVILKLKGLLIQPPMFRRSKGILVGEPAEEFWAVGNDPNSVTRRSWPPKDPWLPPDFERFPILVATVLGETPRNRSCNDLFFSWVV